MRKQFLKSILFAVSIVWVVFLHAAQRIHGPLIARSAAPAAIKLAGGRTIIAANSVTMIGRLKGALLTTPKVLASQSKPAFQVIQQAKNLSETIEIACAPNPCYCHYFNPNPTVLENALSAVKVLVICYEWARPHWKAWRNRSNHLSPANQPISTTASLGTSGIVKAKLIETQEAVQEETQKPKTIPASASLPAEAEQKPADIKPASNQAQKQKPAKTLEDILKEAKPGKKTHKSTQFLKPGNYDDALDDFGNMGATDIRNKPNGEGKIGILPTGDTAIVRPDSSAQKPTLEIQCTNGDVIKIRYGN